MNGRDNGPSIFEMSDQSTVEVLFHVWSRFRANQGRVLEPKCGRPVLSVVEISGQTTVEMLFLVRSRCEANLWSRYRAKVWTRCRAKL